MHPDARGDKIERTRHALFIGGRLALVLTALISVPPYLVIQGRPNPVDALIFAWSLAPLLSVWVAIRSGDLIKAHVLSLIGLIGMGASLAVSSPAGTITATIWLVLAPLDALFALSIPLVIAAAAASLLVVLGAGVLKINGIAIDSAPVSHMTSSIVISLVVLYVCAMVVSAIYLHEVRRRSQRIGSGRYQTLSGVIGDLVLRLDRGGHVLFAGNVSEQLIGRSSRALMGRGLFERVHVGDRPAYLKAASDAFDSEISVTANLRIRVSSASGDETAYPDAPVYRWFELRVHKIMLQDFKLNTDESVQAIAVLRDITIAVGHASELNAARIEAESASKWKDRFLANVSHELRTPLNAIIGFSEILGDRELIPVDPAKQLEYARIIHESGHHLLSVVNSILDISKIEAGSFDILPEPFEVRPLIDQCCDMLSLRAQKNGIGLVRKYPENLEELVADKRAFRQVIINLLSNAVKFTPSNGVVSVSASVEGNSMVIEIADTGIGITKHDLARLGDPFFQAHSTYDRPYEGTGLGLSVVRGLVGLHGGSIILESAPDEGTCVSVRFPLDCRAIAKERMTSARIEAIPLKRTPGAPSSSLYPGKAKKIA